ncbi:hypothetical protein SAMN04488018_101169 [Myroides marinus]|uniref:Uncharacterized protein n=1 Tax=Myroides marinus TaxID=703342 RepID=A0A1H6R0Z3_9FLAO|nr:hypothetical protein [Myroides marinus]SEI49511.1 hypothetical protein SAMN04488018_101169 [Myroides marinus]
MKKLLFYFSLALLTISVVGCSKDDNTPSDFVLKDLFVEASDIAVDEGGLVTFKAYDGDRKEVSGVDFYVDNVKATQEYKFEKRGVYNIIAKKAGYKNSAALAILVGGTIAEKLTLEADSYDVRIGDKVMFTVTADGRAVSNYYIENKGYGLFSGNSWNPSEVGTYTFYAFKEGFFNSEVITIMVSPKEIKENQYFVLKDKKYGIDATQLSVQIHKLKDENDEARPYMYTDEKTGKKYQVYELLVMNTDDRSGIIYLMGVYVSANETGFVFPEQAEKANVFPISVIGMVQGKEELKADANAIDKMSIEWVGVYDSNKEEQGPINYYLSLKDKSADLKYEGTYEGIYGSEVKEKTTKVGRVFNSKIKDSSKLRLK